MTNENDMVLNFEKILMSGKFSALTKLTIQKLQRQQYFSISEFVQWISDTDLNHLNEHLENMYDDEDILQDVMVLSEALAIGEGITVGDAEGCHKNLQYFTTIVTCESLKRKGLVEMFYNKISLEESMSSETFVRLKQ